YPREDVSTETLDQCSALAGGTAAFRIEFRGNRAPGELRQPLEHLADDPDALADFQDADPDAVVHVTAFAHRDVEGQCVIRRIREHAARIECPAGCAADVTAGGESGCKRGIEPAGANGAVLQRRRVVVE